MVQIGIMMLNLGYIIILIVILVRVVIAALIGLLTTSVAMAKDGVVDENGKTQKPKLIDILSTAFGINLSFESIKEYANQKFNQVTQWVKGWFK